MSRQNYHFTDFLFLSGKHTGIGTTTRLRRFAGSYITRLQTTGGSYKGLTGVLHTICALATGLVLFHGTIKRFRLNLVDN
jgi:hypothetical protein